MLKNLTKEERKIREENLMSKALWLPIVILLAVVPLIMRAVVINPEMAAADAIDQAFTADIYSSCKASIIMVLNILMGFIFFFCFDKTKIKIDRMMKIYFTGIGLFFVFSLASTIFSKYKTTAWWGIAAHSEGMVMIACYVFMTLYTIYSFWEVQNFKYIIGGLSVLVVAMTILGALEFNGYNLFQDNEFFKNLMISKEVAELGVEGISNDYEKGKVIGTMMHYNYVGSFGAMMLPLFISLAMLLHNKGQKLICGVMALCSAFILFGSTSRGGLIGLAVSILVAIIVYSKKFIKEWKITLAVLLIAIIGVVGLNSVTNGVIFSRIPILLSDIAMVFEKTDEDFDYKDYTPVREIVHEDGKEKIVLQEHTLYLGSEKGSASFTDENGESVMYDMDIQGMFTTKDERFSQVVFKYGEVIGNEEGEEPPIILQMSVNKSSPLYFQLTFDSKVILVDSYPIQEMEIAEPETFGFKGKEKMGSARGYIWSRSIPLMKHTFLLGNGPDTFAIVFPQNDYIGKWWAYGTPNMIIDKAHNLYLSIFINNGGIAFVGFMILIIAYIVQCFKLYTFKGYYDNKEAIGSSVMLAIIGYLGAGFFNDSVVPVAPIFWILLGTGIAVNYLVKDEAYRIQERINRASMVQSSADKINL